MIKKKINKLNNKSRVLVIPLDWGLGHATRCIPLIKELQANGCEVIIAAETATKSLLENEFQQLTFLTVKGYRISYSKKSWMLPIKIISQVPRLLIRIYNEHAWLKKVVKKYSINAIIADNRFGLYHSGIPSIYITHQLLIKTGNSLTEKIAQKMHFWFIKQYWACWVPDFGGKENIAGELSHPLKILPNIIYMGCLSRFEKKEYIEKKYDLLLLISGPEPQRTIFEEVLMGQLHQSSSRVLLVRGLPGIAGNVKKSWGANASPICLTIKNHLSALELNDAIQQSEWVISRSGYTTIMDLIKLQQKAILVPTPGQTEQEYLARHLMEQHFFFAAQQKGFNLTEALEKASAFSFVKPSFDMDQYKKTVCQFVQSLQS